MLKAVSKIIMGNKESKPLVKGTAIKPGYPSPRSPVEHNGRSIQQATPFDEATFDSLPIIAPRDAGTRITISTEGETIADYAAFPAELNGRNVIAKVGGKRKQWWSLVIVDVSPCHWQGFKRIENKHKLTPEMRHALTTEAEFLWQIRHRNIVMVLGLYLDATFGEPKYIILEREHGSLGKWLRDVSRISLSTLALLCRDILRGLVHIHTLPVRAVAYCGLSLEGVLIFVAEDGAVTVKLSNIMDAASRTTSICSSGSGRGDTIASSFYRAPEAAEDSDVPGFDGKLDVFSFGVILAEIVMQHVEIDGVFDPVHVKRKYGSNRSKLVDDAARKLESNPVFAMLLRRCTKLNPLKRLSSQNALNITELLCAAVDQARIVAEKDAIIADMLADKEATIAEKERLFLQVNVIETE